jgi:hypothetical protein
MAATIDLTGTIAFVTLRAFLLSILPGGVQVVRGQSNRVSMPKGPFMTITPLRRTALSTNVSTYADPVLTGSPVGTVGSRSIQASMEYTVQADVYGDGAEDNAQIVATLFRSGVSVETFAAAGIAMFPLYAGDIRQMVFNNSEQQYEDRWSVDLVSQLKPIVTIGQEFAASLNVILINVDAEYPP